jgi:hypothetical protein
MHMTLVVCRGKSAEYVDTVDGMLAAKRAKQIILVNDWHNEFPECIRTHKDKVLNFLSVMHARRPQMIRYSSRAPETMKYVRTHGPAPLAKNHHRGPMAMNDDLRESIMSLGIQREFDDIWNSGDTGIMAVAYASIFGSSVVIVGLDFWEAPYWTCPSPAEAATSAIHAAYDETKRKKGRHSKDKFMKLLIDFMRVHTSCMFLIHTGSPTFKASLEDLMKTSDHVKLI